MPGVGDGAGDNGVCRLGTQSLTADMRQGDELSAYRPGCRGNPKFQGEETGWTWQVGAKGGARRLVSLNCFVRGTDR